MSIQVVSLNYLDGVYQLSTALQCRKAVLAPGGGSSHNSPVSALVWLVCAIFSCHIPSWGMTNCRLEESSEHPKFLPIAL